MNRIVVVSNRVQIPGDGVARAGGLAVALDGVMSESGGMWFGWSGKIAAPHSAPPGSAPPGSAPPDSAPPGSAPDEGTRNARPRRVTSVSVGPMQYATVDLTAEEHAAYYNDFSNATLWPLLHSMPCHMSYSRHSAAIYRQTNARMADALVPLLRPNDLIWVHDYHLMPMPAVLRARGVTAPIGFFLHVPFPSPDLLAGLPDAGTLVRDLLSADLLGFQTESDRDHFAAAAQLLAGATRISAHWLQCGARRVRLGAFPVEIEARSFADIAAQSSRAMPTARLHHSLDGRALILGIDRLDPTKGLVQRLAGFRRLLETRPDHRRRVTLLQIAAQSRTDVSAYQDLRLAVDAAAGALNSEYGDPDWTPARVLARGGDRAVIAGYMREARVGLVTPLRDGMNLVAKEFIAAQNPKDPGVLILSRFAGAARQLTSALLVNPHDADGLAEALAQALAMKLPERQERWRAAWAVIENATPARWGQDFLTALRPGSRTEPPRRAPICVTLPVRGAAEVGARLN